MRCVVLEANAVVRVRKVEDGEVLHFGGSAEKLFMRCALSPNDQSVLATDPFGVLWIFSMETGKIVIRCEPFPRAIRDFAVSRDGKMLGVIDGEGIWNLKQFPQGIDILAVENKELNALAISFSLDCKEVVLHDQRGNTIIWPIDLKVALQERD
ncbi:MAG: hypothetical protein ACI97A_004264 [Planctomycetota bacterium]